MRVLITGANGFVGKNLYESLSEQKDIEVTTLNRETHPFDDISKLSSLLSDMDAVIHLAGKPKGEPLEVVDANLRSTIGLLDALSKVENKPKLIFASSFAVYAEQEERITENTPTIPRNMYGWSKLWAEQAISHYVKIVNFNCLILRLANVYGPGMLPFSHSIVSTFIELARSSKPIQVNGDGSQKRDFVYVEDVVSAIKSAIHLEPNSDYKILNICSGKETSLKELIDKISTLVGKKVNTTFSTAEKENGYWIGDGSMAKKVLGWEPKVKLEDGLAKTLEY